jgi:hypothetical protein
MSQQLYPPRHRSSGIPDPPTGPFLTGCHAEREYRDHSRENGYCLVVKRSKPDNVPLEQRAKFYLVCDRHHRQKLGKRVRNTNSRATGCPYKALLRRINDHEWIIEWSLDAEDHNHPPLRTMLLILPFDERIYVNIKCLTRPEVLFVQAQSQHRS